MTRRLSTAAAVVLVLLVSCAAWAGYPMTVKDARGKNVTIKSKPVRIVSLAPSNTEILFAIGLKDRIVGVTSYCDYPAEAKKKPKIGDVTASSEAVVALKPDLVVAHAFLNDSAIPRLEKLGLTVFAVDPKTIAEVARDIRTIGKITARPKTAESVAEEMERVMAAVRKSCAARAVHSVLVVIQANPLWAAGPKTFVDEMIHAANAKNTAYDARPGFVTFSKELAVSRNPDVIIVGVESEKDFFLKNPIWKNTKAVKNGRVYVVDPDTLVRPGPRLASGMRSLAAKLNF